MPTKKYRAILYKDNSHELLDEIVALKIAAQKFAGKKMIQLKSRDGSFRLLDLQSVADVLTMKDFYKRFPAKRPNVPPTVRELVEGQGLKGILKETKGVKAMQDLIIGLRKYIASDRYQGSQTPKDILKKANQSLIQLQR